MPDLADVKCPFNEVSVYPPELPYIGQQEAHDRLAEAVREMDRGPESVFCAVYGDWAIGKSRLAHEIVAEACQEDRDWLLVDGLEHGNQLVGPLLQSGVLPLFVPYVKVLNFETFGINSADVLGKVVTTAFAHMAERTMVNATQLAVIDRIRGLITTLHSNFDFSRLSLIAQNRDEDYITRANKLFQRLRDGTTISGKPAVRKLLVLVDEVESAGEINPFATQTDRAVSDYPVPLRSIRDLTDAIKSESRMTTYPDISFLFLNSLTVKRHTRLDPLARRQMEVDLNKATADDFELLVEALRATGYPIDDLMLELARTAFFAADRNIGWFCYIMRRVHFILQEYPHLTSPAEIFQEVYRRTGKVFQPHHFEDRSIPEETKGYMRRVVYHQMPARLSDLDIPPQAKKPMLEDKDPFGTRFVGEVLVTRIDADSLTTELLKTGRYSAEHKPQVTGEGSPPFNPATILRQMRTFAWRDTEGWWVYVDPAEFERQLNFAFGTMLTSKTATTIHKILTSPPYRQPQPADLVAPTMSFLLRFNELWGRLASPNWLPEQQWEALLRYIDETPQENEARLLLGVAKLLSDRPDIVDKRIEATRKQIVLRVDERDILNVTANARVGILKASTDHRQTCENLKGLKGMPVLLLFDGQGAREGWERYLDETHQKPLAIPVIARAVQPETREYEFCIRYAFRDEENGFKPGDVTPQGRQERDEFKSYWEEEIKRWIANLDQQGYVFRPFIASVAGSKKFAKTYPLLVAGKARQELATLEGGKDLLAGLNDVQTVRGPDTLPLIDDDEKPIYPSLFPRILSLLEQPRKLTELEGELFYARSSRTDVTFPKTGSQVLDQILTLLASVGLIEETEDKRYVALSEQRLGRELDTSLQQLGSFEQPYSNYAEKAATLDPSLRQLADTLGVNFDMLLSLKVSQIAPVQTELAALKMQRLRSIPADQQAFALVAAKINEVRKAARKVVNKDLDAPPEIDPETLPDRIAEITADAAYHTYSVEYRMKFLDQVVSALEGRRQSVQKTSEERRSLVKQGAKYSLNDDGSAFPTGPLVQLLSDVERDVKLQLETSLPARLKQDAADLPLKNRIGAGAIAAAIKKLQWYKNQLSETNPDGWWTSFLHTHSQWQAVLQKHRGLEGRWTEIQSYFAGTASEHKAEFIGRELEDQKKRVATQTTNFAATIEELADASIDDLSAEIESIEEEIDKISASAESGYSKGQAEILALLGQTDLEAVRSLAARMGKPLGLEDPESITRLRKHHEQHNKLHEYQMEITRRGIELCGTEGLFNQYLEIRRAKLDGVDGEKLEARFGMKLLKELAEHKIVMLRLEVEV